MKEYDRHRIFLKLKANSPLNFKWKEIFLYESTHLQYIRYKIINKGKGIYENHFFN